MGGEGGVAGVGGVRGRGNGGAGRMTGRSSVESTSMGTREAHAFAQPPTQEGFLNRVATTVDVFPAIVEALSCYKRIHGHLKMLPTFRVAATAPWPENLWGLELGKLVRRRGRGKMMEKGGKVEGGGGRVAFYGEGEGGRICCFFVCRGVGE